MKANLRLTCAVTLAVVHLASATAVRAGDKGIRIKAPIHGPKMQAPTIHGPKISVPKLPAVKVPQLSESVAEATLIGWRLATNARRSGFPA